MQHPYLPRTLPAELELLIEVALDLRWTWSHAGDALWQTIDPKIWERTQNPWMLLQNVRKERLEALVQDQAFLAKLAELKRERTEYYNQDGWFLSEYPDCRPGRVAYFSMEYGLGEALPIYAGGLGILAGDLLKSASDLNLPLPEWDAVEADELYGLLEEQIIPEFYQRDERGIPGKWVARIRASMAALAPEFSSNRMLRDYVENYYIPATTHYRQRIDNHAEIAKELAWWQKQLTRHWSAIYMQNFQVEALESGYHLNLHVYLDELPADFVEVEVFADNQDNNKPFCRTMERKAALPGAVNGFIYETTVPADRAADDYTPRLVPLHCHANIPAEEAHIKWYR